MRVVAVRYLVPHIARTFRTPVQRPLIDLKPYAYGFEAGGTCLAFIPFRACLAWLPFKFTPVVKFLETIAC